jgi:hypothetical protein
MGNAFAEGVADSLRVLVSLTPDDSMSKPVIALLRVGRDEFGDGTRAARAED